MSPEGAKQLLKEWGGYLRSSRYQHLGYPRENTIGRIMREGPGASQSTTAIESVVPESFERVNEIVLSMANAIQEAVRCRYVQRLNNKLGSQACHCSQAEFQKRVTRGIDYTAGAFTFAN